MQLASRMTRALGRDASRSKRSARGGTAALMAGPSVRGGIRGGGSYGGTSGSPPASTPHRRSTVLPRFDRGSLLVGALSPPRDAGMATPQVGEHRRWTSDAYDPRYRASSTEGGVYAGCMATQSQPFYYTPQVRAYARHSLSPLSGPGCAPCFPGRRSAAGCLVIIRAGRGGHLPRVAPALHELSRGRLI